MILHSALRTVRSPDTPSERQLAVKRQLYQRGIAQIIERTSLFDARSRFLGGCVMIYHSGVIGQLRSFLWYTLNNGFGRQDFVEVGDSRSN